ncbi:DUF1987 domain-containing protein [Brumimicrobium aurantiacum]|uniref:DUF1987 domain-containing protein n=1 Tax=Brumimicrobium aurantiacum TaxID=1737063 RepID=A0A3E1EW48_9FLAO|nr:DUF1987 domain-containing protein [Brumimicrobium aurantiacum]RFC53780.1 DUF1987 domain-containing protein [Brumimicrobium aurantiacum]
MKEFELEASAKTPKINFNAQTGKMLIEGRAISEPEDGFWEPVLKWFYAYATTPYSMTQITFNLDYFNISSSKQILFLLYKLNEIHESGLETEVIWKFSNDDFEMKEAGLDFSCVVNVPFQFEMIVTEKLEQYA